MSSEEAPGKGNGVGYGVGYGVAEGFTHQVWRLVSFLLSFDGGELSHVTTSNCRGSWGTWSGPVPVNKRSRIW